jgi:hypothetical protein
MPNSKQQQLQNKETKDKLFSLIFLPECLLNRMCAFAQAVPRVNFTFYVWLFVLRKAFLCLKYRLKFFGAKKLAQMC